MASVNLIAEEEATGKVKEIFEDIKARLNIDFVPNLYRAMAAKPDFLEASWKKSQTVMRPGKLDRRAKEIIAVAVSAVNGCDY
jgi:alkylhydroperoxidase/carboxymuconolactone decarboxylase family protein YurZ